MAQRAEVEEPLLAANSGTERHRSEIFDFVKLMVSRCKVVASKCSAEGTGHSTVGENGVRGGQYICAVLLLIHHVIRKSSIF